MIQVCDFSKTYKDSFKISGINFSVEPGKITGIVGANGSGKSTIIKAICGLHYADGGKILTGTNPVGYVPELPKLPEELYVCDFLQYTAKVHGISDDKIPSVIKHYSEKCALSDVLLKKIKTLSKGYHQRLSLCQALLFDPENLVLDEPFSGLDPVQIVEFRKLLRELSKTKSILISTHILSEVKELCDSVVVISGGKQIAYGTEKEILLNAKINSLEELLARENADL